VNEKKVIKKYRELKKNKPRKNIKGESKELPENDEMGSDTLSGDDVKENGTDESDIDDAVDEISDKEPKYLNTKSDIVSLYDSIYYYGNAMVTCIKIETEIWFKGKEIATILGYADPTRTIQKKLKERIQKIIRRISGGS